jgi:hypothetical protein
MIFCGLWPTERYSRFDGGAGAEGLQEASPGEVTWLGGYELTVGAIRSAFFRLERGHFLPAHVQRFAMSTAALMGGRMSVFLIH